MDKYPDPFKIQDVDSDTIAGCYVFKNKQISHEEWNKLSEPRDKLMNEPQVITKVFGNIRFDSQNKPRFHGQFDPDSKKPVVDVEEMEKQIINKLAKDSDDEKDLEIKKLPVIETQPKIKVVAEAAPELSESFPMSKKQFVNPPKMAEFDFKHTEFWTDIRNSTEKTVSASTIYFLANYGEIMERKQAKEASPSADGSLVQAAALAREQPIESSELLLKEVEEEHEHVQVQADAEPPPPDTTNEDEKLEETMTAFDYLNKLKEGHIKPTSAAAQKILDKFSKPTIALDSQGFNSFIGYAPDLTNLRRVELVKLLAANVLFNERGLLILNKPYGLISQGKSSEDGKSSSFNLPDLLPDLTEQLMKDGVLRGSGISLSVCHRLDRNATGCLVLATDKSTASQVQELFAERQVRKEYLTITRGIPENPSATIDIPIQEGRIGNKERMVLRPTLREELHRLASPSKMAKRAVTFYSTIHTKGSAALLKISTETGVKHQIRVHLGFGLRCPILGDHKYSHLETLAPQKLPSDMLMSLNVRPSKVRNIPLHLHSQVIFLPRLGKDASTVIARAPLPSFFTKTMHFLRLVK